MVKLLGSHCIECIRYNGFTLLYNVHVCMGAVLCSAGMVSFSQYPTYLKVIVTVTTTKVVVTVTAIVKRFFDFLFTVTTNYHFLKLQ